MPVGAKEKKMKTFKKILAGVLATSTLLSVGLMASCASSGSSSKGENAKQEAFIKELGGVSETFKGMVSRDSFTTQEAAAKAYVRGEVAGDKSVSIVNTTTKGVLNEKQIAALNLSEDDKQDIVGVETVEVEYTENTAMAYAATDTLNKSKKVTVYIIKYPNTWKYYTPCPVTGETITKSYYDSVFDSEKYKNCTMTSVVKLEETVTAEGETANVSVNVTSNMLCSETAIYLETSSSYSYVMSGVSEAQSEKLAAYIVQQEAEGGKILECYVKMGDSTEWIMGSLHTIGFDTLEELQPFYDQYLDYTYFTKSSYGFELNKENAQQYVEETLGELDVLSFFGDINMFAKYYVSNGVLSGMRMDMQMEIDTTLYGTKVSGKMTAMGETKVTNYGTTVVEKPFQD